MITDNFFDTFNSYGITKSSKSLWANCASPPHREVEIRSRDHLNQLIARHKVGFVTMDGKNRWVYLYHSIDDYAAQLDVGFRTVIDEDLWLIIDGKVVHSEFPQDKVKAMRTLFCCPELRHTPGNLWPRFLKMSADLFRNHVVDRLKERCE